MTQEERRHALDEFMDPNSGKDIILVTSALGAVSLNLQAAATVICIEIPISFYILLQILGRINRISQVLAQRIYLL